MAPEQVMTRAAVVAMAKEERGTVGLTKFQIMCLEHVYQLNKLYIPSKMGIHLKKNIYNAVL